ncbi:LANO_0G08262g1_1 [Lachancea nothofagi CBS 11611]|uniref:LANO_0G08262g1_1 n=1 Tax=Lachancea nothofagi CBS 11611 TaxID=1266666 RepID=A0A1G4KI78_9SACH|nr:LANO_0G08262g1_1 [Lachancea nothofagi CBS 11611]
MNSLYELDSKWRDLLTLNNFLGGLTVHEFVQDISNENSLKDRAAHTGAWEHLDPKPYIRTFESTVKELQKLSTDAEGKKGQLEQEVAKYELLHSQRVLQLTGNLKTIVRDSGELDLKLTNVAQVVSPLGEKLEKAMKRKNMYVKSVELISHYSAFHTKGISQELELLRTSRGWKPRTRAAILVKNLLVLTKKVETKSLLKTVETTNTIEKYADAMENEFLVEFNNAYRENDFDQLNEIAIILNRYNSGLNVIQSFINQHEYFIDIGEDDFLFDESFKVKICNIDCHAACYETTMVQKLDEIESLIKNESKIVKRVFEGRCSFVMQLFVQRIFGQKLEPRVEALLNASLSLSDLAFVRMLYALFSLLSQFVKDLSEFFQLQGIDNNGDLVTALERCLADLFSKTIYDRTKYFDLEKRSLENSLAHKTSRFCLNHDKEICARALNNKLLSGAHYAQDLDLQELRSSSNGKLSQINNFLKSHLEREKKKNSSADTSFGSPDVNSHSENANLLHIDPNFSLQGIDGMLKCAIESIARVLELVPSKANEYTYELVEIVLLGTIGSYVDCGLEVSYSQMIEQDLPKNPSVEMSYLDYVSKSTEILSLISASIKTVVLPLFVNSPDIKKAIITVTNHYIKRCELLINIIIEETVHAFTQRFVASLSKQKKKDFLPGSQDIMDHDTLPASEIIRDLNSLYSQVRLYLRNDNLRSFLQQIGSVLCRFLFEHYKKFQVSSVGGIIVTKDIIGIQTAIEEWSVDQLLSDFATLRELANLFTVQPEELSSLTNEGHLATVDRKIISAYVAKRDDFNQNSFVSKLGLT